MDDLVNYVKQLFTQDKLQNATQLAVRRSMVSCLGPHGFHKMAYVDWGRVDNPNVLICVHGFVRNGRDFDYLARQLSQHFRVICPDLVGRGESDWLGVKTDYTIEQYMSDLMMLLARLNVDNVYWLGTSLGAIIGMQLAALPRSPIKCLILNDTGAQIENAGVARIFNEIQSPGYFSSIDAAEIWFKQQLRGMGVLSEEQWGHLIRYGVRPVDKGYTLLYDTAMVATILEEYQKGLCQLDYWKTYRLIRCPTLLLHGQNSDVLSEETVQQMKISGPCARVLEVNDVGHAPALMDDAQIKELMDFCNSIKTG